MMIGWLKRMFAEPTCPGCGSEIVDWVDFVDWQGYRLERRWRGCPNYRDAPISSLNSVHERDRHAAHWTHGKKVPLSTPDGSER